MARLSSKLMEEIEKELSIEISVREKHRAIVNFADQLRRELKSRIEETNRDMEHGSYKGNGRYGKNFARGFMQGLDMAINYINMDIYEDFEDYDEEDY